MSEVRETSWNNAESHVLKHFTLELCKMIYKSHLIIMHSLHISGTFTCSPIVKVCVARLAGPSKTPQNSTNSWSRFAKEFGSRLNWQTGKYTTSQTGAVFWVMSTHSCIMSWNGMWWNVMLQYMPHGMTGYGHVMPMSCLMSVKFKSIRNMLKSVGIYWIHWSTENNIM